MRGLLGGPNGKEPACNVGELGLMPGLGRSPGEGNGNLLQYSCLESFMDRGAGGLQSMESQRVNMILEQCSHMLSLKLIVFSIMYTLDK